MRACSSTVLTMTWCWWEQTNVNTVLQLAGVVVATKVALLLVGEAVTRAANMGVQLQQLHLKQTTVSAEKWYLYESKIVNNQEKEEMLNTFKMEHKTAQDATR
ncbi:hypothetical protein KRP22_015248 [Phytophthora ramorum]|nr:hypothetical protein KRP22_15302 [Phytophthora ramorum]